MDAGTLWITLGVQTTDLGRATTAMSAFEAKVLLGMNKINASIQTMSTQMQGVTAKTATGMRTVETETNAASAVMKGFGGIMSYIGGVIAGAFAVKSILNFVSSSMLLAASMEGVSSAFGKMGQNDTQLDKLRVVTRGVVSDFDLMKMAIKAANFKIPFQDLVKYLDFAASRAVQMKGSFQDVETFSDKIIVGVGRKFARSLAPLGLVTKDVTEAFKTTGGFMKLVDNEMARMGDIADTTSIKIGTLKATWTNWRIELGNWANTSSWVQNQLARLNYWITVSGDQDMSKTEKYFRIFSILFSPKTDNMEAYNTLKKHLKDVNAELVKEADIMTKAPSGLKPPAALTMLDMFKGPVQQTETYVMSLAELKQHLTDLRDEFDKMPAVRNADSKAMQEEISDTEYLIKKLEEFKEPLKGIITDWRENSKAIDIQSAAMVKAGQEWDEAGAHMTLDKEVLEKLTKLYPEAAKEIMEVANNMKYQSSVVKEAIKVQKEFKDSANTLNDGLSEIKMKAELLGPVYDDNSAKLELYNKSLDKFADIAAKAKLNPALGLELSKLGITGNTLGFILSQLTGKINDTKKAMDDIADERNIAFLEAQAHAFGGVDNQIELAEGQLQKWARLMKDEGSKHGLSDEFLRMAKNFAIWQDEVLRLKDVKQFTFLSNMRDAFKDSAHQADFLAGKIELINHKMEDLSSSGQGNSKEFLGYAKQINQLNLQQGVLENLTSAFTDFFSINQEGFKHFDQFVKQWAMSILQSFQHMIAEIIAKKAALAIFNMFTGGIGKIAAAAGTAVGFAAMGLAKGGTVPGGYPGDTYPALLTSGETVVPYNGMKQEQMSFEPVEFVIKENQLTGILKKADTKNSIY
jgi:hypothetical protein